MRAQRSSASCGAPLADLLRTKTRVNDWSPSAPVRARVWCPLVKFQLMLDGS
jgi:hypothetical protein